MKGVLTELYEQIDVLKAERDALRAKLVQAELERDEVKERVNHLEIVLDCYTEDDNETVAALSSRMWEIERERDALRVWRDRVVNAGNLDADHICTTYDIGGYVCRQLTAVVRAIDAPVQPANADAAAREVEE